MQIRKQAIGIFIGFICVVLAIVWLWMPRTKEKKELKIGVSLYSDSDTFVDSIVSSMQEQAAAYEGKQNAVTSAAARGSVDAVIAPAQTRKHLIMAFSML